MQFKIIFFLSFTFLIAACGGSISNLSMNSESGKSEVQVPEITVQELKSLIDNDNRPFILDVREEWEYSTVNLDGHLIPLNQLTDRLGELDPHREDDLIVVHCRSGARSAKAVTFLQSVGLINAKNLRGGVLAWSKEIDPSLPTY